MKKFLSFVLFALVMLLPSCGGTSSADSVAEKIENKQELDQKDYTVMIDYADKVLDEAGKLIENTKGSTPEEVKEETEKLDEKFPHFELFMQHMPDKSKLDEANKKKFDELTMKIIRMTMQAQMPAPSAEE